MKLLKGILMTTVVVAVSVAILSRIPKVKDFVFATKPANG